MDFYGLSLRPSVVKGLNHLKTWYKTTSLFPAERYSNNLPCLVTEQHFFYVFMSQRSEQRSQQNNMLSSTSCSSCQLQRSPTFVITIFSLSTTYTFTHSEPWNINLKECSDSLRLLLWIRCSLHPTQVFAENSHSPCCPQFISKQIIRLCHTTTGGSDRPINRLERCCV